MAHTTKHGTVYSNEDWKEMQENFADEADENEAFEAKLNGMETYLRKQLQEMGISKQGISALTRAFKNGTFDEADYQFTNGRGEKVTALWTRWNKALNG